MKFNWQSVVVAVAPIVSQSSGGLLAADQRQKFNLTLVQKQALRRLTMKTNDRILGILDSNQQQLSRSAVEQGKGQSTGEAIGRVALRPEQQTSVNKAMENTQKCPLL